MALPSVPSSKILSFNNLEITSYCHEEVELRWCIIIHDVVYEVYDDNRREYVC